MSKFPSSPHAVSLLPTVREFSSTNIMKLFLCLAGKHVPTTGKPENRFLVFLFFFFSDQQGLARFPRDSFLYKEINSNPELQEMKVTALTFQLANEDTAQML